MKNRTQRKLEDVPSPNLTPMIDVVFNLIIFFMVITDMTQKDLEFLVVPEATARRMAVEPDQDTIIVNVVDPDSDALAGRRRDGSYDSAKPPIFLKGRQVRDLEDLRDRLYILANPRLYPDLDQPELAHGVRPSRKSVLIRCDQGQIFGWVQGVMQMLGPRPGVEGAAAIEGCPMVRKVEIAVRHEDEGR